MTKLQELMEQGYRIQVSEYVTPDTVFAYTDPDNQGVHKEGDILVFHPLNYSYIAYEGPFIAHDANMGYIYNKIEEAAADALRRLDAMVDYLNHQYDPMVVTFLHNVSVQENPYGSFTFEAQAGDDIFDEDRPLVDLFLKGYA